MDAYSESRQRVFATASVKFATAKYILAAVRTKSTAVRTKSAAARIFRFKGLGVQLESNLRVLATARIPLTSAKTCCLDMLEHDTVRY